MPPMNWYHVSYDIYALNENEPKSMIDKVNEVRKCFGEFYKDFCGKNFTVNSTFYISNHVDINKTTEDIYKVFTQYAKDNDVLGICDIDIDICEIPENPNRLRLKFGHPYKD